MSGNTYVVVVYASPPLSGGGVEPPHVKLATLRKMQSPVALELLELLPRVNIPQPNAVVVSKNSPTARSEHGAV
jgi:hypothetical protein